MALALLAAGDSGAQAQRRESQPPPAAQAQPLPVAPPLTSVAPAPPTPVRTLEAPKTEAQFEAERKERAALAVLNDQLLMLAALLVAVGAFLAIAFAVQTLYLGLGLRAMRRSSQLAERNVLAAQRAFVYLGSLAWSPASGGHIRVGPIWANAGTTPTRNLRISTNWKAWHGELPVDFPYVYLRPPQRLFLGPNARGELGSMLIPIQDIEGAIEERLQIYLWGRATYEDVFEGTKPHYFEFCHRIDVTGTAPNNIAITFAQYGFRNGCDEDTQRIVEASS